MGRVSQYIIEDQIETFKVVGWWAFLATIKPFISSLQDLNSRIRTTAEEQTAFISSMKQNDDIIIIRMDGSRR